MADSALNEFLSMGPTADRLAFTPNPPTPASGAALGYLWWDTTLNALYAWDGAAWQSTGGGGGDLVLISSQVISVATPTVTFLTIPGTYKDLVLSHYTRGTASAAAANLRIQFNADTGANYDSHVHNVFGTVDSFAQTFMDIGSILAATSPSLTAGAGEYIIPNYAGTTFHKTLLGSDSLNLALSGGSLSTEEVAGWWRNTAAITEIDLTLSAGNFDVGSVISLYGRGS